MSVKIKPLGDLVLVKLVREEMSQGGIVLPASASREYTRGSVVAVGPGRREVAGLPGTSGVVVLPVKVEIGAAVILSTYGGKPFKQDGEEYVLIREDDVLAVIEE